MVKTHNIDSNKDEKKTRRRREEDEKKTRRRREEAKKKKERCSFKITFETNSAAKLYLFVKF